MIKDSTNSKDQERATFSDYTRTAIAEQGQLLTDNDTTATESSTQSISVLVDSINPHRSIWYIILLSIIVGGLQLSWCTEFSEGTPFLLSLGVSKHTLALIWIAGPLSGSLGQPIIGVLSDNCQYRSGRRKPFIIGGCIATSLSLFYLSHSVELIALFYSKDTKDEVIKKATIPFAALGVYLLDFSISAIQAASRAFIVDNVGSHQQQIANAMAAIMIGVFNIIGYFLGSLKLDTWLPFLGSDQFKVLANIASLTLILTTSVSLLFIKERDPTTDVVIKAERRKNQKRMAKLGIDEPSSILAILKALYKQTRYSIQRLPPQVKTVCYAEFFAWIGYFPMLFYTTTYVGDLYKYEFYQNRDPTLPPLTNSELAELNEQSIRRGSLALLLHSLISFAVDLILPALCQPFQRNSDELEEQSPLITGFVSKLIEAFRVKFAWWLSVRRSWCISHIVFIICMISTFFIRSSAAAIVLFGVLGITWGSALWSPFVLISEEISRIKEIKTRVRKDDALLEADPAHISTVNRTAIINFDDYEHEAGIILGLHNFFVAAPQVISSLFSSFLFKMLSGSNGDNTGSVYDSSLGWVFRFGGIATFGALYFSLKVKTNETLMKEEAEIFDPELQD